MAQSSHVATSSSVAFASEAIRKVQQATRIVNQPLKEKEPFLTNLDTSLSNVTQHLESLQQSGCPEGSDAEKRVLELLAALTTLIKSSGVPQPPLKPKPYFERNHYASLIHIINKTPQTPQPPQQTASTNLRNKAPQAPQQAARTNLKSFARSSHKNAPRARESLLRSLEKFSDVKSNVRGLPLSDLITISPRPVWYDESVACLRQLHATLCHCSLQTESCPGTFMANVALAGVSKTETKNDIPFDFLFLHRHPEPERYFWKQVRILVVRNDSKKSRLQEQNDKKVSAERFCSIVRRKARGRLLLDVVNENFVNERMEMNPEQFQRLFVVESSGVSLATVLAKRKLQGNLQLKLMLSYLLAKAVWQFYDSKWMAAAWSKHTIHFMRERSKGVPEADSIVTLIHKPYFATNIGPSPMTSGCPPDNNLPEEQDLTSSTHSHPKILALGIMLLEIELGEGIEFHRVDDLYQDDDPIENDDHFTAGYIIGQPIWAERKVYQALKDIVEICIKSDMTRFGTDNVSACDNLYTYVVAPLGRLFKQAWSCDGNPESFSPDPVSFKSTELPPEADVTGLKKSVLTIREAPRPVEEISGFESGQLLGDEDNLNTLERRRTWTDQWFINFQRLLVTYGLLGRGRKHRIKVAILDSGINVHNPEFSDEDRDRIKEKMSFIGGDGETDISGHGTHVAAIILKLTKNVDIYVGKITNSSSVDRFEDVEKALIYARTQWRVDMINISFGFDGVRNPDTMGNEIRQCLHEGIMVFASASNDGGEGSRTYPAKYSNVVCAHSATCSGSKSEYNPGLEEGHNFSFVGEHVRPIWRAETRTDDSQMKYVSGTSYAAPVAVSVAAFMIGYIRKKMPDYPWTIKPWSPQGILTIFEMMAMKIDGYDWVSPTRYMKYTKEEKIMGDLKQYLG